MTTKDTDVLIAGGGLAGLSLAHQLISASPELDITVVEKRKFPVPRAIAKIGESTVEIGSHYLKYLRNQLKCFALNVKILLFRLRWFHQENHEADAARLSDDRQD